MRTKFLARASAAIGVLVAWAAGAPAALADSTTDVGGATVTLGGFSAAESVYRSRNEEADIGSTFSGVPFTNAQLAHMSEFRMTARQSRLSVLIQGNADPDTHVAFWGEFDFLGDAQTGNSNESNSYNLRIRNIYGQVDWDQEGVEFLAGQNWSLATLQSHGITPRSEVSPATIDAQYSVGFVWSRQPQLRIVKNWNHQFWLGLSIENPQTTFAGGTGAATATGISVLDASAGGSLFDKNNNFSLNHVPDVIGKAVWEPVIGDAQPLHIEAFGIFRSYYDRVTATATNSVGLAAGTTNDNSHGGGVGGSITYTAIPKMLDLQASVLTGSGIGRYGSGQLPDVVIAANGSLDPIQETMVLLGATLHATPALDLYVYAGQEAEQSKLITVGTTLLGLGQPGISTAGCFTLGGSCSANLQAENQVNVGEWWRAYQGKFGSLRIGLQYSYTRLTDFAGVGGKPTTDDNMFFTSVRYYPF
jgi:hypothetical protein